MKGLLGFLGTMVVGSIGWWLGSLVGITTAIVLSSIGSGLGLYLARRLGDTYLE